MTGANVTTQSEFLNEYEEWRKREAARGTLNSQTAYTIGPSQQLTESWTKQAIQAHNQPNIESATGTIRMSTIWITVVLIANYGIYVRTIAIVH